MSVVRALRYEVGQKECVPILSYICQYILCVNTSKVCNFQRALTDTSIWMSGPAGHNNFFPDMSLAKMHLCVLSLTWLSTTRRRSRLTNAVEFKACLVVRMTLVVKHQN